jgi:hypothetical protein
VVVLPVDDDCVVLVVLVGFVGLGDLDGFSREFSWLLGFSALFLAIKILFSLF